MGEMDKTQISLNLYNRDKSTTPVATRPKNLKHLIAILNFQFVKYLYG